MRRPNKEQLREVIRRGNPDQDCRIVLRKTGLFELVTDFSDDWEENYIDRTETLDRGDGWVGEEAAEMDWLVSRIHKQLLASLIKRVKREHYIKGMTMVPFESEEELEKELDWLCGRRNV